MFLTKILIYRKDIYNLHDTGKKESFDWFKKPTLRVKGYDPLPLDNINSYVHFVDSEQDLIKLYNSVQSYGLPCLYIMDSTTKIAILIGPAEEEALKINHLIKA